MAITVKSGNGLTDLRTLFNDMDEVYLKLTALTAADVTASLEVDMELPVLDEGVTFNTGDADVTRIKLTTGVNWVSKASAGDPDISLQVASIDGKVNETLLEKLPDGKDIASAELLSGTSFQGAGYKLKPKKVVGAIIMFSEDKQTCIVLPNVEMYSSLVLADGDNPAYFNVQITPLENADGADIFILWKTTTSVTPPSQG